MSNEREQHERGEEQKMARDELPDAATTTPQAPPTNTNTPPPPSPPSPTPTTEGEHDEFETGPAPTPFDHPFFLPAVCIGFTIWFGYDTYIHPMEEHLDFNFYGFKVVLAAAGWYSYLAFCEMNERRVMPWVLPGIFAVLAAWLGAEAFSIPGFVLPELVEYPAISKGGFYLALAMVPLSAFREFMRARRANATEAAA